MPTTTFIPCARTRSDAVLARGALEEVETSARRNAAGRPLSDFLHGPIRHLPSFYRRLSHHSAWLPPWSQRALSRLPRSPLSRRDRRTHQSEDGRHGSHPFRRENDLTGRLGS